MSHSSSGTSEWLRIAWLDGRETYPVLGWVGVGPGILEVVSLARMMQADLEVSSAWARGKGDAVPFSIEG